MKLRSIKLFSLLCAAPLTTWAVTLDQLVDSALQQHPDLEFSRGSLEAVRIQESSLPWWDAPELRVGYGRDTKVSNAFRSNTYPDHEYEAAFRVFPMNPWERSAELRRLKSESSLLELSLSEGQQAITSSVKELYWDCVYLGAELELKKELRAVLTEQEARQQALLEGGQITVGQSLSSRMNRLEVSMEVESLQSDFESNMAALAGLCAVEPSDIVLVDWEPLTATDFELPYETWKDLAFKQRADVRRYGVQAEAAQADLDTIKARDIPWLKHVQANYSVRNKYGDEDSAGIEFAINLPFLASDGGEKRIAKNLMETRHRQASQARKITEHEVRALMAEFQASKRLWETQGEQLQSMRAELSAAIEKMESQGNHANESYWDARLSQMRLELKLVQQSRDFQALLLKAERVLGASPR